MFAPPVNIYRSPMHISSTTRHPLGSNFLVPGEDTARFLTLVPGDDKSVIVGIGSSQQPSTHGGTHQASAASCIHGLQRNLRGRQTSFAGEAVERLLSGC